MAGDRADGWWTRDCANEVKREVGARGAGWMSKDTTSTWSFLLLEESSQLVFVGLSMETQEEMGNKAFLW